MATVVKVTTARLRQMKIGDTVHFPVGDPADMDTGKSLAYRVGRRQGCRFTAQSDYENNILTLTKLPR